MSLSILPKRNAIGAVSRAGAQLSTPTIQEAAVALYRGAGYRLVGEEIAEVGNNKTVGSGLRRFHFEKIL